MKLNFRSLIIPVLLLAGFTASAQNDLKLKQIQQGSLNGQVIQMKASLPVWDSFSYLSLKDKPTTLGTVTSVALAVPAGLSVTGSPITGAGTLTIATTLNGPIRGTGTGFTTGNINLASEVTGTLGITNGGTGLTATGTAGSTLISNGSAWVATASGNLVAGTNVTLSGTLTNRLLGTGNITINATGGGSSGTYTFVEKSIVSGDITGAGYIVTIAASTAPLAGKMVVADVNGYILPASAITVSGSNFVIDFGALQFLPEAGDYFSIRYYN